MYTAYFTDRLAKGLRTLYRAPAARLSAVRSELYSLKAQILAHLGYGQTGRWGERVAALHIQRTGALVLTKNWCAGRLEADIIAVEKRTLVVVEVKTRNESFMHTFPARHAVTNEKTARLSTLACAFMRQNSPLCRRLGVKSYRLDTLEVYYRRTCLKRHHAQSVWWHKSYVSST